MPTRSHEPFPLSDAPEHLPENTPPSFHYLEIGAFEGRSLWNLICQLYPQLSPDLVTFELPDHAKAFRENINHLFPTPHVTPSRYEILPESPIFDRRDASTQFPPPPISPNTRPFHATIIDAGIPICPTDHIPLLRKNISSISSILTEHGIENKIDLILSSSSDALLSLADAPVPLPPFDFVYIDGDHSEAIVFSDLCYVNDLLSPFGTILLDDFGMLGEAMQKSIRSAIAIFLHHTGTSVTMKYIPNKYQCALCYRP